jgi:hypothetical protein
MSVCAREIPTVVRQPCPVYLFSQTDQPIGERSDLGAIGNVLRSQLDDSLAKDNFERYWLGLGDFDLTGEQFDQIISVLGDNTPVEQVLRFKNPELLGRSKAVKYDFYDTEFGGLLGDAWIIYDNNGQPVGLYDEYDFNSKPLFKRKLGSEAKTRGVAFLSRFNDKAKPFTIRYRGSGD